MNNEKQSKLREIKQTASDAVEIMRQIGNPSVQDSLNKVKDTAEIVNDIIRNLNTPEMVKNIENFRLVSENLNNVSSKMETTMQQLRETGVLYEVTELIQTAKGKINSFSENCNDGITSNDLRQVSVASKEMFLSLKDLMDEITLTVTTSKNSVTVNNFRESVKGLSNIYHTAVKQVN